MDKRGYRQKGQKEHKNPQEWEINQAKSGYDLDVIPWRQS